MSNSRIRDIGDGLTVEMIATRVELDYTPAGAGELTAIWWGREFLPVSGAHEQFGTQGHRMETRLSDYADAVLTVTDPITGQEVTMSAVGWVAWAKLFYDYAHNAQNPRVEDGPTDDD